MNYEIFFQIGFLDVVIPPDFIAEDTSSDVIVSWCEKFMWIFILRENYSQVPEGSSVKLTCRWVEDFGIFQNFHVN